ncbi:MAG: phosphatase PAP2 family protein [Anaerolineales bacterium]|jgi:membrane-associated phospholipid phosphatase
MFPYEIDLSWVIAFQSMGDWLVWPMQFFSFLGTEEFYILVMPLIYWCIDARMGIQVGMITLLSGGLNFIFKIPLTGPRPYWMSSAVKPLWAEVYFGIPSGHAQQSVVVWGSMAAYLRRGWAWGIALFLMLMIGLSRVFLGAHFFVDMFAGWLIGALLLWLFLRYWDPIANWARNQSLARQYLYAFLVSIGIVFLGLIAVFATRNFVIPGDWIINASRVGNEGIAPFTMSGIITSVGSLFGFLIGVASLARRGGWQVSGPVWKRVVRFVIGLLGVVIIWYGLGQVFPRGESFFPYALRFVRYTLVGIWIAAGAPIFFTKLKLS